jgi:hypothetical protein
MNSTKERRQIYYEKNRDKIRAYKKKYRDTHKQQITEHKKLVRIEKKGPIIIIEYGPFILDIN